MLAPSTYYHIYNHANGDDNLFREQENFRFFLQQYQKHIPLVADTLAYCLMPNHFHFVIKTKTEEEIISNTKSNFSKVSNFGKVDNDSKIEKFISKQFANLFSSYTQAFNKKYNRRGSLFVKNFKRKLIASDGQLQSTILYVHTNPVHHGFTDQLTDWQWLSYHEICSPEKTIINKDEIINLFGNIAHLQQQHRSAEIVKLKVQAIEFE